MARVQVRSEALEKALATRNMTKSEFARLAGLHRTYLSDLLAGRSRPGPRARDRIMSVLGGTFDDWFEVVF